MKSAISLRCAEPPIPAQLPPYHRCSINSCNPRRAPRQPSSHASLMEFEPNTQSRPPAIEPICDAIEAKTKATPSRRLCLPLGALTYACIASSSRWFCCLPLRRRPAACRGLRLGPGIRADAGACGPTCIADRSAAAVFRVRARWVCVEYAQSGHRRAPDQAAVDAVWGNVLPHLRAG